MLVNFGGFVPLSTVDWHGRAVCTVFFRGCSARCFYLFGVEGAEREGSLRKEGGESGAPSSLSPRTAHLNAIGGPI